MTEPEKATANNIGFAAAFKAAVIESLSEKRLITATEKASLKQTILYSK